MINYWKQFEGWATELRADVFFRTRLRLTASYILSLVLLFAIYNVALQYTRIDSLRKHFEERITTQELVELLLIETSGDLERRSLNLSIGVLIASLAVGYFLAGITLRPLREIMSAQKRFIADASHELRTPLSIMKTNAEVALLEGTNLDPKEAIDTLKSSVEEIDRMASIIQNLLGLSQFDRKTVEMPFSKIDLTDVVLQSVQSVDRLANKKRIRINITRSDSAVIWGNITALEEATLNILKNAVFYTPDGGLVFISIKNNSPHNIELSIGDTGIGISAKDLPHIFEPFFKADTSRIRKAGESSGLGLAIVKEVVKKHHGTITVKSAPGKGTTVKIIFPIGQAPETTETAA